RGGLGPRAGERAGGGGRQHGRPQAGERPRDQGQPGHGQYLAPDPGQSVDHALILLVRRPGEMHGAPPTLHSRGVGGAPEGLSSERSGPVDHLSSDLPVDEVLAGFESEPEVGEEVLDDDVLVGFEAEADLPDVLDPVVEVDLVAVEDLAAGLLAVDFDAVFLAGVFLAGAFFAGAFLAGAVRAST